MILTDSEIRIAMRQGNIVIRPFNGANLGANSYDVHLAETIATFKDAVLDAARDNEVEFSKIPSSGLILVPQRLYLGATVEYTETRTFVPWLDGKSGVGRLGISIHVTAGRGDLGFKGHWTMEIHVKQPIKIYAGMPIGQLTYFLPFGQPSALYEDRATTSYGGLHSEPKPVPSKLYIKVRKIQGMDPL